MQRRIDLAVMKEYELRELLERYKMLRRMAQELGAVEQVDYSWKANIDEIEAELALRAAGEDVAPF